MKSEKTIKLSATGVENIIKDLSLIIVSMDHIGSKYHDNPKQYAAETNKFLIDVKAFKTLAKIRGILSEAHESQSTKEDVSRLEEEAEQLPYWR